MNSSCSRAWPVCVTAGCLVWITQEMQHVEHASSCFAGQLLDICLVASKSMMVGHELVEQKKGDLLARPSTVVYWQRREVVWKQKAIPTLSVSVIVIVNANSCFDTIAIAIAIAA